MPLTFANFLSVNFPQVDQNVCFLKVSERIFSPVKSWGHDQSIRFSCSMQWHFSL